MLHTLLPIAAALSVAALLGASLAVRRARRPAQALRTLVAALVGGNGLMAVAALAVVAFSLWQPVPVYAQEATAPAPGASQVALGAALATGLACIGAGIAVGISGAAAIGGITEKPEILGRTLIFVGLAEGIAIYGLIISFMILSR